MRSRPAALLLAMLLAVVPACGPKRPPPRIDEATLKKRIDVLADDPVLHELPPGSRHVETIRHTSCDHGTESDYGIPSVSETFQSSLSIDDVIQWYVGNAPRFGWRTSGPGRPYGPKGRAQDFVKDFGGWGSAMALIVDGHEFTIDLQADLDNRC